MADVEAQRRRGTSVTVMRDAVCKDCQRDPDLAGLRDAAFIYSESWGQAQVERGGSRSDRCPSCRRKHKKALEGLAVGFMDLRVIGAVADRLNPTGPLGGLGPLPAAHTVTSFEADLDKRPFGMTDAHILEALGKLSGKKRVLVLKAGTGTGKSTFGPFRLAFPPEGAPFRLTDHGPIIVTEPRVQATIGVANFVGTKLAGTGVGPGHLVGYQVAGDKNHDDSCQIVYATDGTVINWLKEGRLNKIGAVIVDEAHERNTNIDLILGFLRRDLARYPHLRVIITSATFDVNFYVQYFGGPESVDFMEVDAVKSFGYGDPLFPGEAADLQTWLPQWWPERTAPVPPKDEEGVPDTANEQQPPAEDLWATTAILDGLRSPRILTDTSTWRTEMPGLVAEQVIRLADGLDAAGIYGDILAFLPTRISVETAVAQVRKQVPASRADIYDLLSSTKQSRIAEALAPRPPGDKRKIVIASNLAETSLTVEGVRFVVDSGLIAQSEWDPATASGGVPTKPHSQAGIRQRWGRVGRDRPGWVFPLYSREQFAALPRDTPPGSTRENQEKLIMKAKSAGFDDAAEFDWPASFKSDLVDYDEDALKYIEVFTREMTRADRVLRSSGALDPQGHLTLFGQELERFPGPAEEAMAVMLADQLACVPEVVVALALLSGKSLAGRDGILRGHPSWPGEWRVEAAARHEGLAFGCHDDLDLALSVYAAWEAADPGARPDELSDVRTAWADGWWVDSDRLLAAATRRQEILESLSPAMKQEVTRRIDLRLLPRARAVLSRAFAGLLFEETGDGSYLPCGDPEPQPHALDGSTLTRPGPRVIALGRSKSRSGKQFFIRNVMNVTDWALTGEPDAFTLLQRAAANAWPGDASQHLHVANELRSLWPAGARLDLELTADGDRIAALQGGLPQLRFTEPAFVEDPEEDDADDVDLGTDALVDDEDTAWPTGNPDPQPDEDADSRTRVLDPRESEANDEPDDETTAPAVDVLGSWRRLPDTAAARTPKVRLSSPDYIAGRRLIVTGYSLIDGEIAVLVASDWLDRDVVPALGNEDLAAGSEVLLIAGEFTERGYDRYRVLYRADGRGRFIAYEASRSRQKREQYAQLATALDPSDDAMLAALTPGAEITGTVLPTRTTANRVSFLPQLYQHLDTARVEQHVPENSQGNRKMPFWPATLIQAPNPSGWATAELDHRDEARGIRHRFGVRGQALEDAGVGSEAGTPLLVQLSAGGQDTRALSISEDEEEALHGVLDIFQKEVGYGARRAGNEPLPGRWVWSKRPQVPARLITELLKLSQSHKRRQDIWEFAVSAHFRRVGSVRAPGRETAGPSRQHAPAHLTLAELQVAVPVGSRVHGQVTSVRNDMGRAWLTLPGGVEGTISAADFGAPTGVLQIGAWLEQGQAVDAQVIGHSDRGPKPRVDLRVTAVVPDKLSQAAALGVQAGAVFDGRISNTKDGTGVFVEVMPGLTGLVYMSALRGQLISQFNRGAPIRVRIDSVRPHPQKGIQLSLSLAM